MKTSMAIYSEEESGGEFYYSNVSPSSATVPEDSSDDGVRVVDDDENDNEKDNNHVLDFSNFPFYGRKEELQLLHRIYKRNCEGEEEQENVNGSNNKQQQQQQQLPIPIIAGLSGTGKSTLVEKFVDDIKASFQEQDTECPPYDIGTMIHKKKQKQKKLYVLSGKYCEMKCEDPFSAIVEAFSGFLVQLQHTDAKEFETFKKIVQQEIASEVLKVLSFIIPDLKMLTTATADEENVNNKHDNGNDNNNQETSSNQSSNNYYVSAENTLNRLKYAFQTLLKVICNIEDRPVIMFLDDLQWADNASIDLLNSLLKDTSLRHFMFIGAIRSNEVDKSHPLSLFFEELSIIRSIERIDLLNLSMDDLGEFICNLLGLYSNEATPLIEVVYRKTKGNIFFAAQMLKELEQNKILRWSKSCFRWEWDSVDVEIIGDEGLPDNVEDVVARRIKNHSSKKLQQVLTVAAYVRSTIDLPILQIVMEATGYNLYSNQLIELLDTAVLEGMLSNTLGSNSYKFVHDQIQHAARSLVEIGAQRDQFREKIGQCMYEVWSSSNKSADWMLFVAADHLNTISYIHNGNDNVDKQWQTVHVNLKAGEKAYALAAFAQASKYLIIGLDNLKKLDNQNSISNNHWIEHYELSLCLYRALVDVELVLGRFEIGNELANELFKNAKKNQEKLPTYMSLANALGRQTRSQESLNLCWAVLRMLGEKPKQSALSAYLLKDLLWMKLFFKNTSDDKILGRPLLKDEIKVTAMRFYDEAAARAYICGKFKEFMIVVLRSLRMSFKYGLSTSTAIAIANYSVYVGMSGDHKMALRLARLAKKITIITKAKIMESRVLLVATRYTEDWSFPIPEAIKTYEKGHRVGMENGDIEFAFYNLLFGIRVLYNTGHSLASVEKAFTDALTQCQIYNAQCCVMLIEHLRLSVLHLTRCSGAPIDWRKMNEYDRAKVDYTVHIFLWLSRLELAVYFGEYCAADSWAKMLKYIASNRPTVDIAVNRRFYSGLVYAGLARQTGLKRYLKLSEGEAKELKKLLKVRKADNYSHRYLILEAVRMTLCKKIQKNVNFTRESFIEAIDAALHVGFINDAALCSELAGEYFLDMDEVDLSSFYFTKALDLYHEWGAFGKVEHLQTKRGRHIINRTEQVVTTMDTPVTINNTETAPQIDSSLMRYVSPRIEATKGLRRTLEDTKFGFDDMSQMTDAF